MPKKIFLLAISMIFICGCNNYEINNESSEVIEIKFDKIIMDENENENTVTSSENVTIPNENITSTETPNTSSTNSQVQANIDYNTVVEIDICDPIVRAYLDAKKVDMQYSILSEYVGVKFNYQNTKFDWKLDGAASYILTISENADFSNSYTIEIKYPQVKNSILVPGKTYYWKVTGKSVDNILGGGKIKIQDAPVRWIYVDGVNNVRDMGGWSTTSGKTVKYEMLYRGAQLNEITENGLKTLSSLNIKTEFDIRSNVNSPSATEGTNFNYIFLDTGFGYDKTLIDSNKEQVTNNYKKIFEILSDRSNYPIYTHCQGGADRTGTYAFLLNGLLGVSYEDLTRDFELTSFSGQKRWRSEGNGTTFSENENMMYEGNNPIAWRELYQAMMNYGAENGCTTLQQSIEHWLINYIGVPQSHIDSFKYIMLE